MSDPILRLVYVSEASIPCSVHDLARILVVSRNHNLARGLSGVLLHHEGVFLQVLEGPAELVRARFAQIADDRRHRHVTVLEITEAPARLFSPWTMGSLDVTGLDDGIADLIAQGPRALANQPKQIAHVLSGFRDGRYRRAVRAWHQPEVESTGSWVVAATG